MTDLRDDMPEELLEALDLGRAEAACLIALDAEGEATSRDLQDVTGFPQPRVSTAVRALHERGWVATGIRKSGSSGRPPHVYRLRRSLEDILDEARREEASRFRSMLQRVERALRLEGRRDR